MKRTLEFKIFELIILKVREITNDTKLRIIYEKISSKSAIQLLREAIFGQKLN